MKPIRIIVVGASGLIGGAMMSAAANAGIRTVGTTFRKSLPGLRPYDMGSDPLRSVVADLGPSDVVILLAGYISPSWILANPGAARRINLDSSKRLVDEIEAAGSCTIFMSTDLVFDGKVGGYVETSAPNPLNLYGQMKASVEEHVLATNAGVVARTGWNVGWNKDQHCPIAQCYQALMKPGARMASDNIINVTDVNDTARGLLAISCLAKRQRIYHLVSSPGIARSTLAEAIIKDSTFAARMAFKTVSFASLDHNEPRPTRAYLCSAQLTALGLKFGTPQDIILRKTKLLDQWYAESDNHAPLKAAIRGNATSRHIAVN